MLDLSIFDFKTDSQRFDHETGILSHIFNKGARALMTKERDGIFLSRRSRVEIIEIRILRKIHPPCRQPNPQAAAQPAASIIIIQP